MKRLNANFLVEFCVRYPWLIIIFFFLLTAAAFFPIRTLEVEPDVESLLPRKVMRIAEEDRPSYSADYDRLAILVRGKDLFTVDGLSKFAGLVEQLNSGLEASEVIDPFEMVTLEKVGSRLRPVTMAKGGEAPVTSGDLEDFKRRLDIDPFSRGLVSSRDGKALAAYFLVPKGRNFQEEDRIIRDITDSRTDDLEVTITGSIPFSAETERYLTKDSFFLMVLVVLTILLSYYFAFRSIRAMILPIIIVITGTIWSLAFMGLLGWKISIVSIVSPPLVLTLGSSYSIHILSEFYRLPMTRETKRAAIVTAVTGVGGTILMASLTTVAGMLCLLLASIQQTRQFGLSTAVGVAATAILSMTLFPALLSLQPPISDKNVKTITTGWLSRGLEKMGPAIVKYRWPVPVFLVILAVGFVLLAPRVAFNTSPTNYFPADARIIGELKEFSREVGGMDELTIKLTAPDAEKNYFLKTDVLSTIHLLEAKISELPDVSHLLSLPSYLSFAAFTALGDARDFSNQGLNILVSRMFLSAGEAVTSSLAKEDFSEITLVIRIFNGAEQRPIDEKDTRRITGQLNLLLENELPEGVSWGIEGLSLNFLELSKTMRRDFLVSTLAALAVIGILCSIAFGSLRLGFLALAPMTAGIAITFILMGFMNIPLDMTTIMMSCVAIGVGVDDAIHFLLRYREEQRKNPDNRALVASETLKHTGRPIVITTVSIVLGLAWFILADFRPIMYFGLLIVLTLSTSCLATLILLPPLSGYRGLTSRKERR